MFEKPSPEYLREALSYDHETGLLMWKTRPLSHFKYVKVGNAWNARHAAKPAFRSLDRDGYLQGHIDDRRYRAHHVIFAILHDRWPTMEIDHRDTDRANNRPGNLREATVTQNRQNARPRGNRSGYKGVYIKHTKKGRLRIESSIQVNGKAHYLGTFATAEDAHSAYCKAAEEHFGEFARSV